MLVNGLNRIRTLWNTLLTAAELGTGTTQETAEDTDIQTVAASSETTNLIATTSIDQFLKVNARFYGTSAASQSITEMIWKTQSPELAASRVTFTAATWNTSSDLVIETRWFWRGP